MLVILNYDSDYFENKLISNAKKKFMILNIVITTNEQVTIITIKTNQTIS